MNKTTETPQLGIATEEPVADTVNIVIIGIGGAGGKLVSEMGKNGFPLGFGPFSLSPPRLLHIDTDEDALRVSSADIRILLGDGSSKGGFPDEARILAWQQRQALADAVRNVQLVFIVTGLGGGTGCGATHVVAKIACQANALTIVLATTPAGIEHRRPSFVQTAIRRISQQADTLILFPHQTMAENSGKSAEPTLETVFRPAGEAIQQCILGIVCGLEGQLVGADFSEIADVTCRQDDKNSMLARFSQGVALGECNLLLATQRALISHPYIADIATAHGLLITISTRRGNLHFHQIANCMSLIKNTSSDSCQVMFMSFYDDRLEPEEVRVGLLASFVR